MLDKIIWKNKYFSIGIIVMMILREGPMKKLPFSHLQTVDITDEIKNL